MPGEIDAARFAGVLWAAVRGAGGPRPAGRLHRHFAGAFDPAWLESLPLPDAAAPPPGQPVALLDARHEQFERPRGAAALQVAYAARPRTRVAEDIAYGQPGTWYALAAWHLSRLAGSSLHVTCSVFTSRYGDETFGAHRDTWYGVVVQMDGAKDWLIGEGLLGGSGPVQPVRTQAGDILLIPKALPHVVSTPADPGHSIHLAFAVDRDKPPR
jgi:hypothetical protein